MITKMHTIRRALRSAGAFVLQLSIVLSCGCQAEASLNAMPNNGIPPALVGTWNEAAASGGQYCDEVGHCTSSYGGSETYAISSNGTFEYSQLLDANLYGCHIQTFLHATGRVSVSGATLTLTPTAATNKKTDTCGSGFNKTLELDASSYTWRLGSDSDGKPALILIGGDGTSATLTRIK